MSNIEYSMFKLESQKLLYLNYKINEEFKNTQVDLDVKVSVNINRIEKNKSEVTLKLKIFEEDEVRDYPFLLDSAIKGIFSWDKNISDDKIEKLLKTNAPAILFSYLRPFIAQLTTFSGFPPLILPLYSFSKVPVEDNNHKK